MCKVTVYDCSIVELPKIENRAGNITPIHGNVNVPLISSGYSIRMTYREVRHGVLMLIRHVISF